METAVLAGFQMPQRRNDANRRELLADVSSFANTAGGDLVFGIAESGGVPTDTPGVQILDLDEQIRQFNHIIRSGLSPRIRYTPQGVLLANGRYVFIIRLERSWYGPHRVIFKDDSRFYGRTTNGKYELDKGRSGPGTNSRCEGGNGFRVDGPRVRPYGRTSLVVSAATAIGGLAHASVAPLARCLSTSL